jgi:2-polyprenyl-6-methoxyphenol hydroxylase-like FAD-dependent oxidoreductase
VQRLDHSRDCAKVICQDRTEYVGQIVVGSDGVNSVVRKEMWRLSDAQEPGRISQKEKNCQFAHSIFRDWYKTDS